MVYQVCLASSNDSVFTGTRPDDVIMVSQVAGSKMYMGIAGSSQPAMVVSSNVIVATASNLKVAGDIVPTSSHVQNIGSSNMRFASVWADEVHIANNTLYLGDTPILGTEAATVNIKADPNQSITIKTTGTGQTTVQSVQNVNISTDGSNAAVTIQSTGAGGRISFGANSDMTFTSPSATFTDDATVRKSLTASNLTVTGLAVFNGPTFRADVQTVEIRDNILMLNKGQVGSTVSAGSAGFEVDRGDGLKYQLLFSESAQGLQAGFQGSLQTVATQNNVLIKSSNLSDIGNATAALNNLGLGASCNVSFSNVSSSSLRVQGVDISTLYAPMQTSNYAYGPLTTVAHGASNVAYACSNVAHAASNAAFSSSSTLTSPGINANLFDNTAMMYPVGYSSVTNANQNAGTFTLSSMLAGCRMFNSVTTRFLTSTTYPTMTPKFAYSLRWARSSIAIPSNTDYDKTMTLRIGSNTERALWGTSSAESISISFWAMSSMAGTHWLVVGNADNATQHTVAAYRTFNIPAANTWTFVTLTVAPPPVSSLWTMLRVTFHAQITTTNATAYSSRTGGSLAVDGTWYSSLAGKTAMPSTAALSTMVNPWATNGNYFELAAPIVSVGSLPVTLPDNYLTNALAFASINGMTSIMSGGSSNALLVPSAAYLAGDVNVTGSVGIMGAATSNALHVHGHIYGNSLSTPVANLGAWRTINDGYNNLCIRTVGTDRTINSGLVIEHDGTDGTTRYTAAIAFRNANSIYQHWQIRGPCSNDTTYPGKSTNSLQFLCGSYHKASFYETGDLQILGSAAIKHSGTTWINPSDERIKTRIEAANLDECYNNLKSIPLKKYVYKENSNAEQRLGWIAQDVEPLMPQCITVVSQNGLDDCRAIDSDQIYMTMYGTIQKLQTKVETLEAQVAQLMQGA